MIGFPVLINFSFIIWSYGNLKQSELFMLELWILGDDPVFHDIIFFINYVKSVIDIYKILPQKVSQTYLKFVEIKN